MGRWQVRKGHHARDDGLSQLTALSALLCVGAQQILVMKLWWVQKIRLLICRIGKWTKAAYGLEVLCFCNTSFNMECCMEAHDTTVRGIETDN